MCAFDCVFCYIFHIDGIFENAVYIRNFNFEGVFFLLLLCNRQLAGDKYEIHLLVLFFNPKNHQCVSQLCLLQLLISIFYFIIYIIPLLCVRCSDFC